MAKCGNCDREIGKLEQVFRYNEHLVCVECCERIREGARLNKPREGNAPPLKRVPQTIERTSKKYKGMQAIGAMGVIAGIVFLFAGGNGNEKNGGNFMFPLGVIVIFFSIILLIGASVGAWWDNG